MEELLHHLGTVSTFHFQRENPGVLCHQIECGFAHLFQRLLEDEHRWIMGILRWAHPSPTTPQQNNPHSLGRRSFGARPRNKSHPTESPWNFIVINNWFVTGASHSIHLKCPIFFWYHEFLRFPRSLWKLCKFWQFCDDDPGIPSV